MNVNLADIMVHIDESLDLNQLQTLEDAMRQENGVVAATAHDYAPHLMLVAYDPGRTTSLQLLQRVSSRGLHGELIGL